MKVIQEIELGSTADLRKELDEVKDNEQFIYKTLTAVEYFAIKINELYVAFINNNGKFTKAKAYKNCFATGATEYDTLKKLQNNLY